MGWMVCYSRSSVLQHADIVDSQPTVLTSKEGRLFSALPGRPLNDPTWDETTAGVEAALQRAEMRLQFRNKWDRRGAYKTIASGISYGGGQKVGSVTPTFPTVMLMPYRLH